MPAQLFSNPLRVFLACMACISFVMMTGLPARAQQEMPPPQPPTGVMNPGDPGAPPPRPEPIREEPPPPQFQGGANSANAPFTTANLKKLRLMKRVPGPECTPEEWAAGKWYKGSHEHNFGWWWVVGDKWYSYVKAKARIPDYEKRSIIVYDDEFKNGGQKTINKIPSSGPAPASVKSDTSVTPAK